MTVLMNEEPKVQEESNTEPKPKFKLKFVLGASNCVFEVAEYLAKAKGITAEKVVKLGKNPKMFMKNTEGIGRSLAVYLPVSTGEVKFQGFVTNVDGKVELDVDEHGEAVLDAWQNEPVYKASNPDEIVEAW